MSMVNTLYQNSKVTASTFFTFLDMYQNGKGGQDSSMTIDEIRRENARWLAQQCGGPKKFADLLDVAEARVSHLIGKTPVKNIGDQTARKIETVFEKPKGWLDTPNAWAGEKGSISAMVRAEDVARLVALFGQATEDGRNQILLAAEAAEKGPSA